MTSIITRTKNTRTKKIIPQVLTPALKEIPAIAQKLFNLAKKIPGSDPKRYRVDPYGKVMDHDQYGLTTSQGWQIGHIIPKSKGGSDAIINLQAMNSIINMSKGNSLQMRSRHNQK